MNRERGAVLSTRLTEAERAIVQSAATLTGVSPCALMRQLLIPAARDLVRQAVSTDAAAA